MLYLFVSIHCIVPALCQCGGLFKIFLSRQLASHQLSKFWGKYGKVSVAFHFLRDSLDPCHSFFPPGTVNTSPDSSCLYWSEKSAIVFKIYPRPFFYYFSSRFFIFQVGLLGIGMLNSLNVTHWNLLSFLFGILIFFCQIFESFGHQVFKYSLWHFLSHPHTLLVSILCFADFWNFIHFLHSFIVGFLRMCNSNRLSKVKCHAFCFFSCLPFLLLLFTIKHLLKHMYLIKIFYNTRFTNAP